MKKRISKRKGPETRKRMRERCCRAGPRRKVRIREMMRRRRRSVKRRG